MITNLLTPIAYFLLIGGLTGYFSGFFLRKISRKAVIIGVFVFLLMFLLYSNTLSVNVDQVGETIRKVADMLAPLGFTALLFNAPFTASLAFGLILGLKRG